MKKRGISIILALIMVLVLLPIGAAKAEGGSLRVAGTTIDLTQNGSYFDGKVVFEIIDGKNVLTLNDYKLENYSGNGIYANEIDLTIVGSAEIGVTGAVYDAIYVSDGNLTLNGNFTLRAQSATGKTLSSGGNLTVEGGALDVENTYAGQKAIYAYGRMTVNGGTVHAKANGTKAIYAYGGIILNNGEEFLLGDANASEVKIGAPVEVSAWEELALALATGGKIILTADVTPENPYWANALAVPSGVSATLDLNGHIVDRGYREPGFDGSVIVINGTLTVIDSAPELDHGGAVAYTDPITNSSVEVTGGVLTGGWAEQYGGVQINGGTFNLKGGSIVGNGAGKSGFFGSPGLGGGVLLQSGSFNMSGGAICGNKAQGTTLGNNLGRGGGVYVNDGVFTFTGGTICGNEANLIGGGVYLASTSSEHDGAFNVSGAAEVTGNTMDGEVCNVYLEEGGAITVADTLTGVIGVKMQTPGVFTSGLNGKGDAANFASDDPAFAVALTNEGEAKLFELHTVTVVGGTADKTKAQAGETVTITANDATGECAFVQWEMLEDVEFARGDAFTTTFVMPDHDVTVSSVYRAILISDIGDQTYTGEEITLTFGGQDVTLDGTDITLQCGTDYSLTYANNVDAGTATVTVTFHDRVTREPDVRMGTKSKTFTIRPASIAAAEIAEIADQTYRGEAVTPEPTVTWNGRTLEKDKDYTLSYSDNVNVGTNPYVTVTGKGNFDQNTGVGRSFRIIPAPLTITAIDQEYIYNGHPQGEGDTIYEDPAEIAQKVTVEGLQGSDALTRIILDGEATEVGTYPGRIQPYNAVIGNATGTVTENYEITYVPGKLKITPANVTITVDDKTKVRGEDDPAFTGTVVGLIAEGDLGTIRYFRTNADVEDAGVYADVIDAEYTQNGNYAVTVHKGSFTIRELYTLVWLNGDGSELARKTYAEGDPVPDYTGETPTKAPTAQYSYTFARWDDGTVDGTTTTYTPIFTETLNYYTVSFVNEDGTLLQEELIGYGETPEYKGATPEKAHTAHNEYAFAGWTPEIVPVAGDATYTATYTEDLLHPTFVGSGLLAYDNYIEEDGELLYRFDVTAKDVLDGALPINSAQIFVTYDHDTLAFRKGEGAVDWELYDVGDVLSAVWASDKDVEIKEGDVILTLWFAKVGEPPKSGIVDFAFTTGSLGDGSALSFVNEGAVLELEARTEDGFIQFDALLYGDANCDGKVTSADASLILRALVGLSELSPRGALQADVDLDGEVTAEDAALILRFVVGLIEELPLALD